MKTTATSKRLLFALLIVLWPALYPGSFRLYGQVAQDRIHAYLQAKHQRNDFRGVVLIVRNDSTLFSKGYGAAHKETQVPNSPQTVYRLGSVTKQFTAAAILKLQEEGKLSVQDRLCQYVENCPAAWKDITLHQLLTHSSGVFNYTDLPGFAAHSQKPHTVAQLLDRFRDKELQFTPGSKTSYSNSGYLLLGHVIERVSGKPYDAYLQATLFRPLGLKHTGYEKEGDGVANRAQGFAKGPLGIEEASYLHMSVPYAAGGLYSTPEDLKRWNQLLHGGKVLSPQSLRAMTTPHQDGMGYGLVIDQHENRKRIHHGGRINGFENYVTYYPADNVYVIVMSNQARIGADAISRDLASLWFGKKPNDSK
ncbi:MAG: beta-lactamase family protein [Cytophagales bacterium]|nr:beta-lactamase family protein [Cytophagales bacterium]